MDLLDPLARVEHALNQSTMAASIRALNGAPGEEPYRSPLSAGLAIPNWLYRRTLYVLMLHLRNSNGPQLQPARLLWLRDRLHQETGMQIDGTLMVVIAGEMHAILRPYGNLSTRLRADLATRLSALTELDVAPVPTLQGPRLPPVGSLSPGQHMMIHYPVVDCAELNEWQRQVRRHGQPTLLEQIIAQQVPAAQPLLDQLFGIHPVVRQALAQQSLAPRRFGSLPLGQEQFRPVRHPVFFPPPRLPAQYGRLPNMFTQPLFDPLQKLYAILFGTLCFSILATPRYRLQAVRAPQINYDAATTHSHPHVAARNPPVRAEDAIRNIITTERNIRTARDGIPRDRSLSPRERRVNTRSQRLSRDYPTRGGPSDGNEPRRGRGPERRSFRPSGVPACTFPPSSSRSRERREWLGRAAANELRNIGASPGF
ncbi:hypothetical protein PV05_02446 [Exophiala xenobiotica]|uniref:Uncharacterized protein n=1 Tax=Exophiala xenobiotica TaxID=348802 RepID=A0A0D2ET21_9EURO|nr:uncharacterized protein PV05_02446 [Exophiala xenobiotica]KIW57890.1 hypothetical protein PV05_02446 [Exophiala xenobiotica]